MIYFTLFHLDPTNLISFDQVTLRSQALLVDELLNDSYDFVVTVQLQSDPIELRFSQSCQMSGGRFLVSLREACRSLIKKNTNLRKEDLEPESNKDEKYEMIDEMLRDQIEDTSESVLDDDSSEVATNVSGYIAKKLPKWSK